MSTITEKAYEKSEEIEQNWTGTENFITCFCVIFDRYYQSLISGRETGYQTLSLPIFELCKIFSNFLRS